MVSDRDNSNGDKQALQTGTITGLLLDMRDGNDQARERLFVHIYDDLKRLARNRLRSHRQSEMETTALANAACERLLRRLELDAEDRRHFFFLLDRAMRDVLVEQVRADRTLKRGGDLRRMPLGDVGAKEASLRFDVLDLHEALIELEAIDPDAARVVSLRFFSGRTLQETADIMDITFATVRSHWEYAKSWLHHRLTQ